MTDNWTDRLAGARMQVDQQFQSRLEGSEFSNQEWGLVMTAVEFDIEHPDDPERAHLIAKKEHLSEIIPELDNIQQEMGGAAPSGGSPASGNGILGQFRQLLGGLTSDGSTASSDDERMAAAERLVDEYTRELQTYLETHDRWDELRQTVAEEN